MGTLAVLLLISRRTLRERIAQRIYDSMEPSPPSTLIFEGAQVNTNHKTFWAGTQKRHA